MKIVAYWVQSNAHGNFRELSGPQRACLVYKTYNFSESIMGNSTGMMLPRPASVSQSIIIQVAHRYNTTDEQRDVFESHRHHIFSIAYYMTGDEREAETILQSTFIEAFHGESQPTIATLDEALMAQLHLCLSLDPVPAVTSEVEGLGN